MGKLQRLVKRKQKQRERRQERRSSSHALKFAVRDVVMRELESTMRKKMVIGNARPQRPKRGRGPCQNDTFSPIFLKNSPTGAQPATGSSEYVPPRVGSPTRSLAASLKELNLQTPQAENPDDEIIDVEFEPSTSFKEDSSNKVFQRMRVAQFRMINEMLYTSNSRTAEELFDEDEQHFRAYHEGYRQQVSKWSVNPLDKIIRDIRSSHCSATTIADLGCGDAKLAATLKPLGYTVHSFDLVAINEHVRACNIRNVPLKPESVDVAVLCLSLMGTDMGKFVLEANRILKIGGRLMIAEVGSRFTSVPAFVKVMKYYGFSVQVNDVTTHQMFVFFYLQKVKSLPKGAENNMVKPLWLKPCLYKKR